MKSQPFPLHVGKCLSRFSLVMWLLQGARLEVERWTREHGHKQQPQRSLCPQEALESVERNLLGAEGGMEGGEAAGRPQSSREKRKPRSR